MWSTPGVLRQALQVVAGLAVGLVIVMVIGLIMVVVVLNDDAAGGGGGPHRAEFIDMSVASAEASKTIALTGDLLLRAKDRSVAVQSLDDLAARSVPLFEARAVSSVAPDGRHLIAFTDIDRWQVIRLRNLRAVADIQGGEPFFVDGDHVLVVFVGRGCKRGDSTVMDLGARTQRPLRLSGDRAGLEPVAVVDDEVLAMRLQPGDSGGCMADGVAAVGLETGTIRVLATEGHPAAVAAGHTWLTSIETTVLDRAGLSVGSGPPVIGAPVGDQVVYAESPRLTYEQSFLPQAPTPLRLGSCDRAVAVGSGGRRDSRAAAHRRHVGRERRSGRPSGRGLSHRRAPDRAQHLPPSRTPLPPAGGRHPRLGGGNGRAGRRPDGLTNRGRGLRVSPGPSLSGLVYVTLGQTTSPVDPVASPTRTPVQSRCCSNVDCDRRRLPAIALMPSRWRGVIGTRRTHIQGRSDLARRRGPISFAWLTRTVQSGHVLQRFLASTVDVLPIRLWRPGNLSVGRRLHFCVGSPSQAHAGQSVRTVEWNGREIAHGHRPFPHDKWQRRRPTEG